MGSSQNNFNTGIPPSFSLEEGVDRSAAREFRLRVRSGEHVEQTSGCVPGHVQANFVALPKAYAFDFLVFCLRNPRPCPLLAMTDPGKGDPGIIASGADLRTDIPRYLVFREGKVVESTTDVSEYWQSDMVGFLLGCA